MKLEVFALAQRSPKQQKERAFQASSPKLPKGRPFWCGPFFAFYALPLRSGPHRAASQGLPLLHAKRIGQSFRRIANNRE
jgi:hypothetical protein